MTISFTFEDFLAWLSFYIQQVHGESMMTVLDKLSELATKIDQAVVRDEAKHSELSQKITDLTAEVEALKAQVEAGDASQAVLDAVDAIAGKLDTLGT